MNTIKAVVVCALLIGLCRASALASVLAVDAMKVPAETDNTGFEASLTSNVILGAGQSAASSVPLAVESAILTSGGSSEFTSAGQIVSNLGSYQLVIDVGSGVAGNQAAIDAFQRAANLWAARISDPITVTINIDMADLGNSNIIGQASSVGLQSNYTDIRNAVVADAAVEFDDAIVASLPTAVDFAAYLPSGFSLDGNLMSTKANFKAIGFTGLDTQFGAPDGTIIFNSTFAFDFDNSDGVTAGTMDFESVAAHEIGHILGFISQVDTIDYLLKNNTTAAIAPSVLDLFRFDTLAGDNPETLTEFTTDHRWLVPGSNAIFDQILAPWETLSNAEIAMSTGSYNGDGWQASHWKFTGLGLMRPALAYGQTVLPNEADFRALDLIGWDILPIPEPGAFSLMLIVALAALGFGRCRHRV